VSSMDQLSEIILRLRISEREAQLLAREIERTGLKREIEDPATLPDRVQEATLRRERSLVEHGEIMSELNDLHEPENWLSPHGKLN
jgi:hypothetical protein